MFMFQITTGRNFFKRRTDAEQHFLEESSTESIAKESIVEMRDITPESIIAEATLRDKAMDMGIPFQIPAKGVKNHNKSRSKILGFIEFVKHTADHAGNRVEKAVKKIGIV